MSDNRTGHQCGQTRLTFGARLLSSSSADTLFSAFGGAATSFSFFLASLSLFFCRRLSSDLDTFSPVTSSKIRLAREASAAWTPESAMVYQGRFSFGGRNIEENIFSSQLISPDCLIRTGYEWLLTRGKKKLCGEWVSSGMSQTGGGQSFGMANGIAGLLASIYWGPYMVIIYQKKPLQATTIQRLQRNFQVFLLSKPHQDYVMKSVPTLPSWLLFGTRL
jgi:hypothetical protein